MSNPKTESPRRIVNSAEAIPTTFPDAGGYTFLFSPMPAKLPADPYRNSTRTVQDAFSGVTDAFLILAGPGPRGKLSDSDPRLQIWMLVHQGVATKTARKKVEFQ